MSSSPNDDRSELYPVFLRLAGRQCVVVGAGKVAQGKVDALVAAGALVRIVSPHAAFELEHERVKWARRPFVASDLDDAWYVVAAATSEANREVAEAAQARRLFVNAVDDPAAASAYLGGVVRRAGFVFALCSNGAVPALTGLIKEAMEALLPDELERWVEHAREEKRRWRERKVPMEERRPLLLEALNRLYAARRGGEDPSRP